ncbi:MAG: hypothetical protein PVI23_05790 [Maricaulaceae bacterium]|jgi:hypothetical protein
MTAAAPARRALSRKEADLALLDPPAVFERPADVLATTLPEDRKIAILQRWAYDAQQTEVAESEGMPMPDNHLLRQVELALIELGAGEAP